MRADARTPPRGARFYGFHFGKARSPRREKEPHCNPLSQIGETIFPNRPSRRASGEAAPHLGRSTRPVVVPPRFRENRPPSRPVDERTTGQQDERSCPDCRRQWGPHRCVAPLAKGPLGTTCCPVVLSSCCRSAALQGKATHYPGRSTRPVVVPPRFRGNRPPSRPLDERTTGRKDERSCPDRRRQWGPLCCVAPLAEVSKGVIRSDSQLASQERFRYSSRHETHL